MAKVLFTAAVADIRGKLNGNVFSRNRGGAYIRTKVTPLNPQTTFQTGVRNFMAQTSRAWRGLSQAQRNAWNQAVANFKGTDIFGMSKVLSGSQLHQKLNVNLLNISESTISSPPVPADVPAFTSMSITPDATTGDFEMAFAPVIGATEKVLVYATAPVSPGVNFVKSEYRLIEVLDSADVTPYDLTASYVAKFGALPPVGQKVFVKVKQVVIASGLAGLELSASGISV